MKLICLHSRIKLKYDIKHDVLKHKYENKTCCVFLDSRMKHKYEND